VISGKGNLQANETFTSLLVRTIFFEENEVLETCGE
jgi:hypothetical protein